MRLEKDGKNDDGKKATVTSDRRTGALDNRGLPVVQPWNKPKNLTGDRKPGGAPVAGVR